MLKLKNYSFSGIGRFVQKQTIDLDSRDHLIQIDGKNQNTGGSSGAGKSTTVEALAFLLGISDIPSTQLQSRITKSPIWVQGEFEGGITITRSKKDGLTIETPEGTVSGNSKLAEEKLDEIIGVDRKLLKTMCYKRQKQGGFFLNLTPKQSHEFLIECLDLGPLKSKTIKLEENIKNKYKPRKIELESSINVLTENLLQLKKLLGQKVEPVKPEIENVEELKLKVNVINQQIKVENNIYQETTDKLGPKPEEPSVFEFNKQDELNELNNSISLLKTKMHNNLKEKDTAIEQATSAVYKLQKKIEGINTQKIATIEKKKKLEELEESYQHVVNETCPTCMREWYEFSGHTKEILEKKIAELKAAIKEYEDAAAEMPHHTMLLKKAQEILEKRKTTVVNMEENKELEELQLKKRKLENEKDNIVSAKRNEYLELFNKWSAEYSAITEVYREKTDDFKTQVKDINTQINDIETKYHFYKAALESYQKDVANINAEIDVSAKKLVEQKKELKELERDILLSEESIRLIKNFTLQKFQDTLDYIGQRATEIINMIPNMANAVIYFENAKETKSGKIKNEVNAVINLESDSKIPIKTLSGGERTSADFAIDLAVGEMIESMTQKGVNFLIIDEGFDGLDSISKIECLEILKSLNTDKKMLIVDHSSEVKEMVYDIIQVNRVNEESYIV